MTNPADTQRAQAREIAERRETARQADDLRQAARLLSHSDQHDLIAMTMTEAAGALDYFLDATAALREENAELRAQLSRAGNCADPAVCNAEIAALTTERDTLREAHNDCWSILGHTYADQYADLTSALKDIAKRLQAAENPPDYQAGWDAAMQTIEARERLAALKEPR